MPAELVCRKRDQVGIGQGDLARALRRVRQQDAAGGAHQRRDLRQRLDHAGLAVDLLHADERARTIGQQRLQNGKIHPPVRIDRQALRIRPGGTQHRLVLHRRDNNSPHFDAADCQGQRLARPAGEHRLALPRQRGFHPRPRAFQQGAGGAAWFVRAGRVGPGIEALLQRGARLRGVEYDAAERPYAPGEPNTQRGSEKPNE